MGPVARIALQDVGRIAMEAGYSVYLGGPLDDPIDAAHDTTYNPGIGQVALDHNTTPIQFLYRLARLVGIALLCGKRRDRHICAFARKRFCRCPAHSGRCPGNDNHAMRFHSNLDRRRLESRLQKL